ncbi:MAG: biosynthetic-type acetolactate synthase large subunit [Clostridia bacterium]|nr:biosynthetic-type acetolactate synthase large subunit [Clostridia bacterium]NDO19866.1 biosynthetic-type acetolactate synthase large subunit [Lachnospiraceae bacterium MD329]
MRLTGAEMAVKALEKNGVKVVFGYPGAANCPIIDKLSFSSIKHILTRNEQGAAHMASGYARVTKQAGVCTATSGPGATNLITGIATAYMDSIPMVALTGQVTTKLIGKDAFQEVDITGATLPFTKHSYLIKDGLDIPKVVNEAFHIANTGRPGPVLIDFPMDILKAEFDYPDEDEEVNIRGYKLLGKANESQVKKVAEAVKAAKKPVILAGGGIVTSDAMTEFRKFVKETDIPVVSTMMGIGTIPTDSPRYYGMIGSHGVKRANMIFNRADLVIVMGSRLGDRTVANVKGLEEGNKLIHIDIDPAEIGKNTQPYIPVVGDIKDVLEQLIPLISGYKADKSWIEETEELRDRFTYKPFSDDNGFVNPRYFLNVLSAKTKSDVYLSTEVGQNQIWCANNFTFTSPRSLLTSGGFGTMGYGLPAAIGASVAAEGQKPVIAVMGDGSFQMDLPEMGTMAQWDIPVKMVLFQNKRLGMVHEHQYLLYKSNYQAVNIDCEPDFAMLAKAYGFESGTVTENSKVGEAIDKMMSADGSYLLIVNVNPFEPTGDALNETTLPQKEDK